MIPSHHLEFSALPLQVFEMGSLTPPMCGDEPTTYLDVVSRAIKKQTAVISDRQLICKIL